MEISVEVEIPRQLLARDLVMRLVFIQKTTIIDSSFRVESTMLRSQNITLAISFILIKTDWEIKWK